MMPQLAIKPARALGVRTIKISILDANLWGRRCLLLRREFRAGATYNGARHLARRRFGLLSDVNPGKALVGHQSTVLLSKNSLWSHPDEKSFHPVFLLNRPGGRSHGRIGFRGGEGYF